LDEALHAEVHYMNTSGRPFDDPLWQLIVHQVNHATQHHSESAVLLTFNYSPGTWLILYLRLVKEAKPAVSMERRD
jgi:uncharacterized damage-inducible protein DinB